MVEIGTVLGAAQTLFAALECTVLKEVCSALGYKSQLEDLKRTVETVKSVLLDAAASEELTHAARDYIERLKTAVYDADDLFDEFRTVAERKQHQLKEGNQLSEKVRLFFSSENPLKLAYKMSKEIKKIRKNLDGIARDRTNFGFAVDSKRIRNRKQETCSYVNAPTVIGREADVDAIVDKLLDLNGKEGARYLTVVGIGGMGKTTLAQLVCDDHRVKNGFYSNVWWVCVADQENNQFDKKAILCKILDLAAPTRSTHLELSLEEVQKKFQREIEGRKFLIVLDDLWNENKGKWMGLRDFLMLGSVESRILVTTRSHAVAKVIGNGHIHVLEGLSDKESWLLFERSVFEEKPEQATPLEVEVGKKIVGQCSNVPLAIKVVGSLLCGQGLDKWRSFEKSGLGGIGMGNNEIMSILKFSYHNLEPSLKSCFTYCALFPKDYEIKKDMLISLWMAQGYIVPFDKFQDLEKASEEHFLILLRRCFFQDVKVDKHGNVQSFKMHDLLHDVAQEVAGQETFVATSKTSNLDDKVRHVFEDSSVGKENIYSYLDVKLRTYLRFEDGYSIDKPVLRIPLETVFSNGRCLRTLTLVRLGIKSLPDSIAKLLHLRYLNISQNDELITLPDSITKLHNLQTLNLNGCLRLRELPKKFSRLVNLIHLSIKGCYINLSHMPVGMDKLTSLCELTTFVVIDESSSGENRVGQLKELKALVNLKGRIDIEMHENLKRAKVYEWEGSCFEGADHLEELGIYFPPGRVDVSNIDDVGENDEALLKKLLPHPNVNTLQLVRYWGEKLPRWEMANYNWAVLLPNLVHIDIRFCRRLKHLPSLSKLKYLQSLTLDGLDELEYIENTSGSGSYTSLESESKEPECALFLSLESLSIMDVPKLKGWWTEVEFADSSSNARLWQRSFPRLSKLTICCYEDLLSSAFWKRSRSTQAENSLPEFRVDVDRVDCLKSLPAGRLTKIKLVDKEIESLAEVGEVFKYFSSLRSLKIYWCNKMGSLAGGLEHLTTLESLTIKFCRNLNWEEGDDNDMVWRHLHQNLCSLKLYGIDNLKILPKGMQHLTSLEKFTIGSCDNFQALPEWINCLSSLQSLDVSFCKEFKSIPEAMRNTTSLKKLKIFACSEELKGRCQDPNGVDWPKIKHIPAISI